jgi:hypothetical protein
MVAAIPGIRLVASEFGRLDAFETPAVEATPSTSLCAGTPAARCWAIDASAQRLAGGAAAAWNNPAW